MLFPKYGNSGRLYYVKTMGKRKYSKINGFLNIWGAMTSDK